MKIEPVNSERGNWIIWEGDVPHYFHLKSEAVRWLANKCGLPGFAEFRASRLTPSPTYRR